MNEMGLMAGWGESSIQAFGIVLMIGSMMKPAPWIRSLIGPTITTFDGRLDNFVFFSRYHN